MTEYPEVEVKAAGEHLFGFFSQCHEQTSLDKGKDKSQ